MAINSNIKKNIIDGLEKILNFNDKDWSKLDINIKTKLIHHYCSFILKKNKNFFNSDEISIPLKSLKPKKLIQCAGFNKSFNKNLYNDFNERILNYTFEFRNIFFDNKKIKHYYTFSSLPKIDYDKIIDGYLNIIYNFLLNNKNIVQQSKLYDNLIANNNDKLIIINKSKKVDFEKKDNTMIIKFDNGINIFCELFLTSDKITNNIPCKFSIKIINIF